MATLDLAGIITRVCTDLKEKFASKSVETSKQDALVSGTNIKTINNTSLLGSGNIAITDTNNTAWMIRANQSTLTASDNCGYNRIFFTSVDGMQWVPINADASTSTSTVKTLNTRQINPFGPIVFSGNSVSQNVVLSIYNTWQYYSFNIRYSYYTTLSSNKPVYLKCSPQIGISVVMSDVVQSLPTSKDGYVYVFLGIASNSTTMELRLEHPVYYHDGTGIRLWTGEPISS